MQYKQGEKHSKSQPGEGVLWEMLVGSSRPKGDLDVFQAKLQGSSPRSLQMSLHTKNALSKKRHFGVTSHLGFLFAQLGEWGSQACMVQCGQRDAPSGDRVEDPRSSERGGKGEEGRGVVLSSSGGGL